MPAVHALTVDVEEFFQAQAIVRRASGSAANELRYRAEANIDCSLAILAEHDAQATFFVLGGLAERFPEAIRRIVENGHELASYGYDRLSAINQGDGPFLADIRLARAVLEDISGVQVKGFRPPGYSIGSTTSWAYECVRAAGYRYLANAKPPQGQPSALPAYEGVALEIRPGLIEIPSAGFPMSGALVAKWGGEAFRYTPYWLVKRRLRHVETMGQGASVFDLRVWEFDVELPAGKGDVVESAWLEPFGLGPTGTRIRRLLTDFRWERVDRIFLVDERTQI